MREFKLGMYCFDGRDGACSSLYVHGSKYFDGRIHFALTVVWSEYPTTMLILEP